MYLFFLSSGVTFPRPPIVNFSLFLCFFLGTSSNNFLFSVFLEVNRQKIVTRLLSSFWQPFYHAIWASLGKTVYSLHHRHVCLLRDLSTNWLVWFFLFAASTFPLSRNAWAFWKIGIQHTNWYFVPWDCLLVHTPILKTRDRQSVSTLPWPKFNFSDFLCTSAGLWGKQKKGEREREREGERDKERERERERESLYLWVEYKFDYMQGPNS